MSKYIIDTGDYLFTTDGVLVVGFDCDNKPTTFYNSLDTLEELNSDYINEHYGELQDEAYKRGYKDGKKSQNDDRIEVGDEVRNKDNGLTYIVTLACECGYVLLGSDGNFVTSCVTNSFEKTGKHYDIASILEAMRK